jgi:hypothetical protein
MSCKNNAHLSISDPQKPMHNIRYNRASFTVRAGVVKCVHLSSKGQRNNHMILCTWWRTIRCACMPRTVSALSCGTILWERKSTAPDEDKRWERKRRRITWRTEKLEGRQRRPLPVHEVEHGCQASHARPASNGVASIARSEIYRQASKSG